MNDIDNQHGDNPPGGPDEGQGPTASPQSAPPQVPTQPPPPQQGQPYRVVVPPPPRRRSGWAPVIGGLVAGAIFGAAAGVGGGFLVARSMISNDVTAAPSSPQTITVNDTQDVSAVTAVAANAIDSVVTIAVRSDVGVGSGSGVVIDDEGHIVTNNHVVTLGGATADAAIRVTTSSGRVYDAAIVGTDPLLDLAVLEVEDAPELVPVEFGDSDALNVGDLSIAIGAPLGYAGTVTSGIISAIDRSIQVQSSAVPEDSTTPQEDGGGPFEQFRFDLPGIPSAQSQGVIQLPVIQTDTAINPGNSGGALLDANGRLIGINVAIANTGSGGNVGVGFAIPANTVSRIVSELIENGAATHGLLGVTVVDVARDSNQVNARIVGASVQRVIEGSGAADAGIRVGDIIVSFDGVPITSRNDLTAQVRTHPIGATVDVVYSRDGTGHTVTVTLGDLQDVLS